MNAGYEARSIMVSVANNELAVIVLNYFHSVELYSNEAEG